MELNEFLIKLPKVLDVDLSDVAAIIEQDIIDHINRGVSIDGKPYPPLKTRSGTALKGTSVVNNIKVEVVSGGLSINLSEDYASFLQEKYNFLGLSDEALRKIDEYIQGRIDRLLGD